MKSDAKEKGLNRIKRLKSVSTAMWGYFCLLAFLLILLVELVFTIIVSTNLEDRAKHKITNIGHEIETELRVNSAAVNSSIFRYRKDGINIVLLTEDGLLVAPEEYEEIIEVYQELKKLVGDGNLGYSVVYRSGDFVKYAVKTGYAGRPHYMMVSYSVKLVRETVSKLQLYLWLVGLTVFLAAFLISMLFSRKLTDGLKTMSDTAVRFAKGDYSVEFTNADYKELASLSDSLNYVRDEVKKSEDFQHEILANVTHDLKTPLTMIKAYASMIKEISGDNKEKREKHLQVIIDEADRLTGLVNDVLSVSKLSANIDAVNPKIFNLTELIYGIINKFGYLQESQGYSIMVDIDSNLYTRADEEKISQVIYNLIGNAANYTGSDKVIYISFKLSMDAKRIKFSVRDTGKGISKEDLPEIWNRYYRVNENHTRPVKGTGLGLNIVKVILENHSFDFGVESEVDKGSTFWIDFPSVPSEIE